MEEKDSQYLEQLLAEAIGRTKPRFIPKFIAEKFGFTEREHFEYLLQLLNKVVSITGTLQEDVTEVKVERLKPGSLYSLKGYNRTFSCAFGGCIDHKWYFSGHFGESGEFVVTGIPYGDLSLGGIMDFHTGRMPAFPGRIGNLEEETLKLKIKPRYLLECHAKYNRPDPEKDDFNIWTIYIIENNKGS